MRYLRIEHLVSESIKHLQLSKDFILMWFFCSLSAVAGLACGWMLTSTMAQASPVPPSTTRLSPHTRTSLYKTSKSGWCRIEERTSEKTSYNQSRSHCPVWSYNTSRLLRSMCGSSHYYTKPDRAATIVCAPGSDLPTYSSCSGGSRAGLPAHAGLICACESGQMASCDSGSCCFKTNGGYWSVARVKTSQ